MNENIRLLIVCSHEQVRRELAAKLFRRLNPQLVGWADEQSAALRLVGEMQADVVLLDAQMVGSFDICRALTEHHPKVKIVVLTSYANEREKQEACRAGAAVYLLKDLPSEELLHCIESVHARSSEAPHSVLGKIAADWS